MTPTYSEVMAIANAMMEGSTITKRREAARRLEQKLASPQFRQKIVSEAKECQDDWRHAVAEMWKLVIHKTIISVEKVLRSRSKLTRPDVQTCFSIIKLCDIPDESAVPEEAMLRGTFRLERKEVRAVINVCAELIDNNDVLEVAELDILDMLAYIAGSRGYVVYLRSQAEYTIFFEEVSVRIKDESLPLDVRQKSAEVFYNLCSTAEELGITMNLLVAGCIKMVAEWCANAYRNSHNEAGGSERIPFLEMSPLIAGITCMIRANMEHAMLPVKRHGRAILRLAKSRYRRVADRTQRHVLNEYFLCHLLVAQTAGTLSGLLPGDLGDLGEASLTPRMINDLLQLAMNRQSEAQNQQPGEPLVDEIQQTHLELTAQLLSCAQRQSLCKLECEKIGADPTTILLNMVDSIPDTDQLLRANASNSDKGAPLVAQDVVSNSPFIKNVLKVLHDESQGILSGRPSSQRGEENGGPILTPILLVLQKSVKEAERQASSAKTLLQILAACAEAFPAGGCWASRTKTCWAVIPTKETDPKQKKFSVNRQVRRCDVSDLATVVSVVGKVLDAHGDHLGSVECQEWALRCLIRLARSTSCLVLLLQSFTQDYSALANAWQCVWTVLFRSDLRYIAYTANTVPNTVAELVLWTLSSIIQNMCTDPAARWSNNLRKRRSTFLYQQQTDIWKLPVFSLVNDTKSLAPFEIVVSLLHAVGLSEGFDSITQGLRFKAVQTKAIPATNRRHRLINFCLFHLSSTDNPVAPGVAATAIAALVNGRDSEWSRSLNKACGEPTLLTLLGQYYDCDRNFQAIFDFLWGEQKVLLPSNELESSLCGAVAESSQILGQFLRSMEVETPSADIMAQSQSSALIEALVSTLEIPPIKTLQSDITESCPELQEFILIIKVFLSVVLTRSNGAMLVEGFDRLAPSVAQLLRLVTENTNNLITKQPKVFMEIWRVVEFTSVVSSSHRLDLPHSIVDQSQDLAAEIEKFLKEQYTNDGGPLAEVSEDPAPVATVLDLDNDDYEDRFQAAHSRKRKKTQSPGSSRKRSRAGAVSKTTSNLLLNAARLLCALKPSLRTVRFIAETLLGVDLDRPMEYYDSSLPVDPVMAASLTLFVTPILRSQETGKSSSGGVLARLVRIARRKSTPASDLHLFGFKECARFCLDDGWKTLCDISSSDAKELLLAWSAPDATERKSLALRPELREVAANSLARAFVGADTTLRGQWQKEYPKLMLPSLCDTCCYVRQATSFGIASSLSVMSSQQKVVESTLRNIPPVTDDHATFSTWYKSLSGDLTVRGKQAWEDIRMSLEFTSLVTMALLGGCANDESLQVSILFRFVEVAAIRPDLETSCLLSCDLFAQVAGFETAEGIIAECLVGLLDFWIEKFEDDELLNVPLLLSAPNVLRFLTQNHFSQYSHDAQLDLDHVRSHASTEFFARNWRFVLPPLFLNLSDPSKPDKRLKTLTSIFDGDYEENMRKFVSDSTMFASMISFSTLMKCKSDWQSNGLSNEPSTNILHYLPDQDKSLSRRGSRYAPLTARQFLRQASFEADDEFNSLSVCAARQFLELCHDYGNLEEADPFRQVGLTLSECCILSRSWVRRSPVKWLEQKKIQSVRLLWAIACLGVEKSKAEMRLDFLLLLFSESCSSRHSNGFLLGLLDLLKDIMQKLTQPTNAPRMARDSGSKDEVRVLFNSLTRLFQDLQKKLLDKCNDTFQGRDRLKRRACGLTNQYIGHRKDVFGSNTTIADDLDGMDQPSERKVPSLETEETLNVLHRIVAIMEIISNNCTVFNIKYEGDIHGLTTSLTLSEDDKKSLASLAQVASLGQVVALPGFQFSKSSGDSTPDLYHRLTSKKPFSLIAARRPALELSPHQHLLLRDLNDVFSFLSHDEFDGNPADCDQELLLHRLSQLCVGTPDDIRGTATRCIGALKHHDQVETESLSRTSTHEDSAFQGDRLEPSLRTKCLSLLLDMVKSPAEVSAVIAMETIKSLLATKNALNRRELTLVHFCSAENARPKTNSLVLDSAEVKRIKAAFDTNVTWFEWCWDPSFWTSCFESDFEDWICNLVGAIIACHFTDKSKNGSIKESGRFLVNCQRMAYLESDFSVAVFPLLIYDLLQDEEQVDHSSDDASFTDVQRDTWIGHPKSTSMKKISNCFSAVLESCAERKQIQDSRAVFLLVDTLDVIRRLGQQRFRSSNGHVKNPTSLKAFRSSTPPSQESVESQSMPELKPVTWCGLAFGVGMYLDGLVLAEACLKVKRYLSSIFYAEHFADVRFRGSTSDISILLEKLAREPSQGNFLSRDISGFPPSSGLKSSNEESTSLINDAIKCFEIMVEATRALKQHDHLEALRAKLSDIRLLAKKYTLDSCDHWNHSSPQETLRKVDMAMSETSGQAQLTALNCLSDLRLNNTLRATIEGLASRPENDVNFGSTLRDKWFEGCLFGNSMESLRESPAESTHTLPSAYGLAAGFAESVFTALQSFAIDDYENARVHIENARYSTLVEVEEIITETSSHAEAIDKLNCLNDMECAIHQQESGMFPVLKWGRSETPGMIIERSFVHRKHQPEPCFTDRVQEVILGHLATQQNEKSPVATQILSSFLWKTTEAALDSSRLQTAMRHLSSIHGGDCSRHEFFQVRHLQARIEETNGDFSSAIRNASQSLERLSLFPIRSQHDETRAELLVACGQWMAHYRVDSGEKILKEYLEPGMELAKKIHSRDGRGKAAAWRLTEACIALGDLVFSIYENTSERIKSPAWKEQGASLRARDRELKEVSAVASQQLKQKKKNETIDPWLKELAIYRQNLGRDVGQIRNERAKVEGSINEYKQIALKTLVQLLSVADDSYKFMSKFVYRMVSLWLSSGKIVEHTQMDMIPSYRFVAMSTQLFSRLTHSGLPLTRLVKRLVSEHPYHSLPQMVRLAGSSENASAHERDEEKASIANDILSEAKSDSPDFLASLVENYETLIRSYNALAHAKTDDLSRGGNKKIDFLVALKSQSQKLRLDKCIRSRPCPPCILTQPPKVRPNADYGSGVDDPVGGERIQSFESNFSIAESGITRPKIVMCIGSRGGRFKQLVKGGDDCRGDAIMQQVFHYVNEIFAQERSARARQLRIVTYNIIPTSATSGVLEWVENTMPFGDYLVDRGPKKGSSVGAHSRYFPGEWGSSLCREQLKKAYPDKQKQKETLETIYKLHSPTFRFFFVERFGHSANLWFEAKTRYTRSVSTTSFVGHVLGIGDRHSNNILVHQGTGEVVHIDFGIVFEQGKLLQVPERVPFRLTRNVVDGFGPTKTDGSFTAASYETMNALRQNSGALLTILSSIVADPLYRWSISRSPKLVRKRQELLGKVQKGTQGKEAEKAKEAEADGIEVDSNEAAEQAVRKVKEKLNGFEDGTAGEQQSTKGQVHFLINLSRDLELLSQMYPGWAPYA